MPLPLLLGSDVYSPVTVVVNVGHVTCAHSTERGASRVIVGVVRQAGFLMEAMRMARMRVSVVDVLLAGVQASRVSLWLVPSCMQQSLIDLNG